MLNKKMAIRITSLCKELLTQSLKHLAANSLHISPTNYWFRL